MYRYRIPDNPDFSRYIFQETDGREYNYDYITQVSEVIASPNFMPENQCIKA